MPTQPKSRSHGALILFAHGARDPAWAQPVEAVAARLRAAHPERMVTVAFLESLPPTLADTVAALHREQGITRIDVLPFFIAQGVHLRDELPVMLRDLQQHYSGLNLRLLPPLGELPDAQKAMAEAIGHLLR